MIHAYFLGKWVVHGSTTVATKAAVGIPLFNDADHRNTIINLPGDLAESTLLRQDYKVDKTVMTITPLVNAYIRVALHGARDGDLNAILKASGWELLPGWYVDWSETKANQYSKKTLDKIWSKRVAAKQTLTFTSIKDDMTFAIFASESTNIRFIITCFKKQTSPYVYVYVYIT